MRPRAAGVPTLRASLHATLCPMLTKSYVVDPAGPRAPTQELWDRMTEEERRAVVASLPSELPRAFLPEGDAHRVPKKRALEALDEFFRRRGLRVYLGSELSTYYPDEDVFAPDLLAVLDVRRTSATRGW